MVSRLIVVLVVPLLVVVYKQLLCMLVVAAAHKQLLAVSAADTQLLVAAVDIQLQVVGHRRHRAAVVDKAHQVLTDTSRQVAEVGRLLLVVADGRMRYQVVVVA